MKSRCVKQYKYKISENGGTTKFSPVTYALSQLEIGDMIIIGLGERNGIFTRAKRLKITVVTKKLEDYELRVVRVK